MEEYVEKVNNVGFFIQETMYHLNQISVGNGTNSENASLVINVRLATMTQSVKTGFYEPAKSRIAFYTHPTAIRGKQLAVVEDLKVVNFCTIKFVYPGKVLKSAILISPALISTPKILALESQSSKSNFASISPLQMAVTREIPALMPMANKIYTAMIFSKWEPAIWEICARESIKRAITSRVIVIAHKGLKIILKCHFVRFVWRNMILRMLIRLLIYWPVDIHNV